MELRTLSWLCMLTAVAPVALCGADGMPPAVDLHADGNQVSRSDRPLVIMVSAADCSYCEALKTQVFVGMERDDRIILREIAMDDPLRLIDFERNVTDHQSYARKHGVTFAPTVLFLDGAGRPLAKPIVGVANLDFYPFYLEKGIEESRRLLADTKSPPTSD